MKNLIFFTPLLCALIVPTDAGAGTTFTFDENGNGFLGGVKVAYSIDTVTALDPTGSHTITVNALTYHIGDALKAAGLSSVMPQPGDWRVTDGGMFQPISDLLRWNSSGLLYVFSQPGGGSLADTVVPFTSHALFLFEGALSNNTSGVVHAPVQTAANGYPNGEPGFIPGGICYTFISEGNAVPTPEPSTIALAALGAICFVAGVRRRR